METKKIFHTILCLLGIFSISLIYNNKMLNIFCTLYNSFQEKNLLVLFIHLWNLLLLDEFKILFRLKIFEDNNKQ